MATATLAHMPDLAKVQLEAVAELNALTAEAAAGGRGRTALVAEISAALAAEKKWLTGVYKSMVAFQKASDDKAKQTGHSGYRVCLQNFNPWLKKMGFPSPDDEQRGIPDPDAEVKAFGEDANLEWFTVEGLRAEYARWQEEWKKRREDIRKGIIDGVSMAHGNFSTAQRNEALAALGFDAPKRQIRYDVYIRMPVTVDGARANDAAAKKKITDAFEAAFPQGLPRRIDDYMRISHEYIDEGGEY